MLATGNAVLAYVSLLQKSIMLQWHMRADKVGQRGVSIPKQQFKKKVRNCFN